MHLFWCDWAPPCKLSAQASVWDQSGSANQELTSQNHVLQTARIPFCNAVYLSTIVVDINVYVHTYLTHRFRSIEVLFSERCLWSAAWVGNLLAKTSWRVWHLSNRTQSSHRNWPRVGSWTHRTNLHTTVEHKVVFERCVSEFSFCTVAKLNFGSHQQPETCFVDHLGACWPTAHKCFEHLSYISCRCEYLKI